MASVCIESQSDSSISLTLCFSFCEAEEKKDLKFEGSNNRIGLEKQF
jgi:hypothetical protein